MQSMRLLKLGSIFVTIIALLLLVACGNTGNEDSATNENTQTNEGTVNEDTAKNKDLIWGSSSLGSQGYVIIEALASTANKYVDFRNSSMSTAGGAENMSLLSQGIIDMGQATSDVLYNAEHGIEPFNEKIDFAQVFAYGYWSLPILVPMDSDIETVEDLKGKTLNVGTTGGSSSIIMNAVLEEYGLIDEINLEHLNNQESAEALRAGQIDASVLFHMSGNLVAAPFQELAQSMELKPVKYDEEILERVTEKNEGITLTKTLKETFDFYTEDTIAPGITGMLVTTQDADEDMVYEITKVLYEHEEEVRNIGPELDAFGVDYAVEGLVKQYPVHPGAAKYFKEVGIWEDGMVTSSDE